MREDHQWYSGRVFFADPLDHGLEIVEEGIQTRCETSFAIGMTMASHVKGNNGESLISEESRHMSVPSAMFARSMHDEKHSAARLLDGRPMKSFELDVVPILGFAIKGQTAIFFLVFDSHRVHARAGHLRKSFMRSFNETLESKKLNFFPTTSKTISIDRCKERKKFHYLRRVASGM